MIQGLEARLVFRYTALELQQCDMELGKILEDLAAFCVVKKCHVSTLQIAGFPCVMLLDKTFFVRST